MVPNNNSETSKCREEGWEEVNYYSEGEDEIYLAGDAKDGAMHVAHINTKDSAYYVLPGIGNEKKHRCRACKETIPDRACTRRWKPGEPLSGPKSEPTSGVLKTMASAAHMATSADKVIEARPAPDLAEGYRYTHLLDYRYNSVKKWA